LSGTAKRLLIVVLFVGIAVLAVCAAIVARSLHSIAAAEAPGNIAQIQPQGVSEVINRPPTTGPSVRVAVIGGMSFTGFWNDLAKRYEHDRGVYVQLIATGEKNDIAAAFKKGGVDVITMHASDTVINLVADGYAMDPQPWMRNDLVIVGPPEDPAGIKGLTDAAAAMKKIAAAKSPFIVHSSLGAQEVLLNIIDLNQIVLDPAQTTVLFDDKQRDVLQIAGQKHAYTLVGRIPFRTGRLPNNGLVLMVRDDPRLRRPYIVAVANPAVIPEVHLTEAKQFAEYLRLPKTQKWIAEYGRGLIDDRPLFFPVELENAAGK
jgi:tungstate transport system substrate-binding protein